MSTQPSGGGAASSSEERLREALAHRPLQVDLELIVERRVHAYARRLNDRLARAGDGDLYDTSDDGDLAQVVMLLCEAGLDAEDGPARNSKPGERPATRTSRAT